MRVVANISVGDEVELIDGAIRHHQALGVDAFVIADICSTDGTRERLQEWNERPDVHVIFSETKNFLDYDWRADMVRVSCERFSADYILRVDADERVFTSVGDIGAVLERAGDAGITMHRFNVVWPSPEINFDALAHPMQLPGLPIAAAPVMLEGRKRNDALDLPWVLCRIGPRLIARARPSLQFGVGAHAVTGEASRPPATDVFVAHLPFTTFGRFRRKLHGIEDFLPVLRKHFGRQTAWHWHRWAVIHAKGEDAVRAEFLAQFMTPEQAEKWTGRKTIVDGPAVFQHLSQLAWP